MEVIRVINNVDRYLDDPLLELLNSEESRYISERKKNHDQFFFKFKKNRKQIAIVLETCQIIRFLDADCEERINFLSLVRAKSCQNGVSKFSGPCNLEGW